MSQKLVFVSGKGGVGKSAVALAMALQKAKAGERVLLIELGSRSYYKDFLGLPEVTYKPLKFKDNLDISLHSPEACLRDYILYFIRSEALFKLFFENKVARALIDVAPALAELSILGKLTSLSRHHGPAFEYDTLIIDGYATGHFLALLRAPKAMSEAIDFGPMSEQSLSIDRVLKNKDICEYHLVALPEEMPVLETEEFFSQLKSEFNIQPKILLNKMIPHLQDEEMLSSSLPESFEYYLAEQFKRQNIFSQRLLKLDPKLKKLPLVMGESAIDLVTQLQGVLNV